MRAGLILAVALVTGCEKHVSVSGLKEWSARVWADGTGGVRVRLDLARVGKKCPFLGSPASITATVNGEPMKVLSRGGADAEELSHYECQSFEASIDHVAGPAVHVEVGDSTGKVVVDVPDLLAPRTMTLVEQGPFKVGDTVHFAYAPKTDDLVGGRTDDIGTAEELEARARKASRQTIVPAGELGFYPSGDLGRQLGTTPLLPGEGGPLATLRFAGVTPGKYVIVPTGQGFRATTKATRCEGVRTCIAMPATTRPLEIELK